MQTSRLETNPVAGSPRIPRWTGFQAAARFEWKQVWVRGRGRGVLGLCLLPVFFAVVVGLLKLQGSVQVQGTDVLTILLGTFYLQFLLVVVPLLFGTALVAQEAEARTLVYLLVRPLARTTLLMGKFLGSWGAATASLCASLLLATLVLWGADGFEAIGTWWTRLPAWLFLLALGTLSYGALFTLVGLVFSRPALVGLFLAFGWEGAIPHLPGWIRMLTVRHHLAALVPAGDTWPSWLGSMSETHPPIVAVLWLVVGSAFALGVSAWLFRRRSFP